MGRHDSLASKRPANSTVKTQLLDGAKEWLAANREAIDAYNVRVERDGVWSDEVRDF